MVHATPPALQVGTYFERFPIPPIPEKCTEIAGGPVTFVVEPRQLTDNLVYEALPDVEEQADELGAVDLDDFGASLHVYGSDDRLEYLRFDCFSNDAHYHYIRNADGGNFVCPLDQIAEGDSVEWTLGRLRDRLPEMLEFAHAPEVAAGVRDQRQVVLEAIDRVADLLEVAQREALADRGRR
ncbi:MAG TPA: hypothetical protein VHB02_04355 [Acidimicrobiales bacterium]|nr:hypothetical protein [Acidimicrobiales bacterium]